MTYKNFDNNKLMVDYGNNDTKAFNELYKRFAGKIHSYFMYKTNSKEVSNDLLQEFFKKIHLNKDKYNSKWKVDTWFFTIARNLLISFYRYDGLRKHEPLNKHDNICENCEFNEECMSEIETAIEKLPDIQKKAVVLKYFDDCPYDEISNKINKTPANTRKIISRALAYIRKSLGT